MRHKSAPERHLDAHRGKSAAPPSLSAPPSHWQRRPARWRGGWLSRPRRTRAPPPPRRRGSPGPGPATRPVQRRPPGRSGARDDLQRDAQRTAARRTRRLVLQRGAGPPQGPSGEALPLLTAFHRLSAVYEAGPPAERQRQVSAQPQPGAQVQPGLGRGLHIAGPAGAVGIAASKPPGDTFTPRTSVTPPAPRGTVKGSTGRPLSARSRSSPHVRAAFSPAWPGCGPSP